MFRIKFEIRITSTYVENTYTTMIEFDDSKDHLHIRGEYRLEFHREAWLPGSPPHTWRIPSGSIAIALATGITSTYVENTLLFYTSHLLV